MAEVKPQTQPGATAPANKPATPSPATAPRDRTSKNFDKNATITLKSEKNPKRVGSKSYDRFEHYKTSKTVGDFIAKGGTFGDLSWDSARGFITISGYTPKMVEKKAKAEKPAAPAPAGTPVPPTAVKGQPAVATK
jgi:hypothetical protein